MRSFTVVQCQVFSQFLIEHIRIFKEEYFIKLIKLNKLLSQRSVKMLTDGVHFRNIGIGP